ncbi:hypothetical protein GOODEAATRI_025819, partial [Goodea atripinnis]
GPCSDGVCSRDLIHFSPNTDFVKEGERTSYISVNPIITQNFLWNGYSPEPVQINVKEVPPAYCYSFTDPHIITFDGRYYENYQIGTFVLYKSNLWPFEVHVRQWECGSLVHAASCVCGFVARDGVDVIAFDMCNGEMHETKPHLSVKSRHRSKSSIRISESYQGRKVTISSDSTCTNHRPVHFRSFIPTLDVTAEYIRSVELLKGNERQQLTLGRLHRRFQSTDMQGTSTGATSSSAQHQSLRSSDLKSFSYFFPEDHESSVEPGPPLEWPTPSGLTQQQARAHCEQTVENSSIAVGCRLLLEDSIIGRAVAMCVADLQLKDELSWLNATLPLLENECERKLVQEQRRQGEHRDAVNILRCPNLCNWNGQCSDWGCVCFSGFSSYDCSQQMGKTHNRYTQRPEI